jgi:hypothetical protein
MSLFLTLSGVQSGGIAGRGVLVDWLSWYEGTKGKALSPEITHSIPLREIEQTIEAQNTKLMPGDMLIIRTGKHSVSRAIKRAVCSTYRLPATGFLRWHDGASIDEKAYHQSKGGAAIGIEQTDQVVEWLWNNHFR